MATLNPHIVNTRDFVGSTASDLGDLNAAIAEAVSTGCKTVIVHNKTWQLDGHIDCGDVRLFAECPGVILNRTSGASNAFIARQQSGESGGGLVGFDIRGNDIWTNTGVLVGGSDFLIQNCTIDGGSATLGRSTYVLIDLQSTAEDIVVQGCSLRNAGTCVRISTAAKNIRVVNNTEVRGYVDKGIGIRQETGQRGPIYIDGNVVRVPASVDGAYSKQPIAMNNGSATTYTGYLSISRNRLELGNVAHAVGQTNTGTADAISLHGASYAVVRENYIYGSGELGIYVGEGGDYNDVSNNHVENCDVGGINLGLSSNPVAEFNTCQGNVVINGALDRLSQHQNTALADYYFAKQERLVFMGNSGKTTRNGNDRTRHGYIFEDCTDIIEGASVFGGHRDDRSYITGTNSWMYRAPSGAWRGSQSTVLQGGGSIANPATGTYEITLDEPLPQSNYHVTVTNEAGTTDSRFRVSRISPTRFDVFVTNGTGTAQAGTFTWSILS